MFHLFTESSYFQFTESSYSLVLFSFHFLIDLFLMSTTMNASDLDKYDFYDEESGKWIHIQDYYESYNNYSKQHEDFVNNNVFRLWGAAIFLLILLTFVFISTITLTIGSFPFFCVVFNKNRNTEKEVC